MVEELHRAADLAELAGRLVVGAAAALLADDLTLRQHHLVGEPEIGHAVRLVLHHDFQAVGGDRLVVGGVVPGGEGVLAPAVGGDDVGELARRQVLGTLEHQVLKEMGEARFAGLLVGGADAVPDRMVDDGRAVVLHHDHLQAVVEGEADGIENLGLRRLRLAEARGKEDGQGREYGGKQPGRTARNCHFQDLPSALQAASVVRTACR